MEHPTAQDRLLSTEEAAEFIGMTSRFLEVRRYRGGGPSFIRISANRVKYSLADLNAWIAEHRRTSTSDMGPEAEAAKSGDMRTPADTK